VQRIGWLDLLAGIKVEPALAALLFAARIPSYDKTLETAVGKWNQILLQGVDAEGIRKVEVLKLAVGAFGMNVKLGIFLIEGGSNSVLGKVSIAEVSQDSGVIRQLHSLSVMGTAPGFVLFGVALGTALLADIACSGG